MNRQTPITTTNTLRRRVELIKKTAIHEAGHAASIYLGNKAKQLPPVFFRIFIDAPTGDVDVDHQDPTEFFAHVEGGRLIHMLPACVDDATCDFSPDQKQAFQRAFEADIVNILAGPLAEAKYVSLRDNETIHPQLIDLNTLNYYGGSCDLKLVNDYLNCMNIAPVLKKNKIAQLFAAAYQFIDNGTNWSAITRLADHILVAGKSRIDCEEVFSLLDAIPG